MRIARSLSRGLPNHQPDWLELPEPEWQILHSYRCRGRHRLPSSASKKDMFSATATQGTAMRANILIPLATSTNASFWGVVTMTAAENCTDCREHNTASLSEGSQDLKKEAISDHTAFRV